METNSAYVFSCIFQPPGLFCSSPGSAYMSKEIRECAEAYGIRIDEAPMEASKAIASVERYHALLSLAFERVRAELDRDTSDDDCSIMTFL